MTSDWRQAFNVGMSPLALLRSRAIEAEEVLILTYTADLRFFERVALAEARAARLGSRSYTTSPRTSRILQTSNTPAPTTPTCPCAADPTASSTPSSS
jgi:hypothetical protein